MSARLEAAAGAVIDAAFGQELPEAPIDLASAALNAADAVMFSDEAIDAAAKKLYARGNPHGDWDGHTIAVQNIYRNEIKFLIATLKENA